jgi:hypothetical protein
MVRITSWSLSVAHFSIVCDLTIFLTIYLISFNCCRMHLLWTNSLSELERFLIPCPFKWLTGCDCPACGTQRSFIELLRGEFVKSWQLNPAGIGLVLFTFLFVATSKLESKVRVQTRNLYLLLLLSVVMIHWLVRLFFAA